MPYGCGKCAKGIPCLWFLKTPQQICTPLTRVAHRAFSLAKLPVVRPPARLFLVDDSDNLSRRVWVDHDVGGVKIPMRENNLAVIREQVPKSIWDLLECPPRPDGFESHLARHGEPVMQGFDGIERPCPRPFVPVAVDFDIVQG